MTVWTLHTDETSALAPAIEAHARALAARGVDAVVLAQGSPLEVVDVPINSALVAELRCLPAPARVARLWYLFGSSRGCGPGGCDA